MDWLVLFWWLFFGGDMAKKKPDHENLKDRVVAANASQQVTCEICNNAQWWADNGFSEAERKLMCGPADLNCPGFGSEDAQ